MTAATKSDAELKKERDRENDEKYAIAHRFDDVQPEDVEKAPERVRDDGKPLDKDQEKSPGTAADNKRISEDKILDFTDAEGKKRERELGSIGEIQLRNAQAAVVLDPSHPGKDLKVGDLVLITEESDDGKTEHVGFVARFNEEGVLYLTSMNGANKNRTLSTERPVLFEGDRAKITVKKLS